MTAPEKPKAPITAVINADVVRRLEAQGVPKKKHEAKLASAKYWWGFAAAASLAAVGCASMAAIVIARAVADKASVPIPLIVALFVPGALAALVALFCASQADSEATKAFVASVITLGKGARGKE